MDRVARQSRRRLTPQRSFSERRLGPQRAINQRLTVNATRETCSSTPPADLGAIELIVPMGQMSDSHVTPVDHAYFVNYLEPEREIDVFSPAEGTVTSIQRMAATIREGEDTPIDDHRIVIDHPCSVSSVFILHRRPRTSTRS